MRSEDDSPAKLYQGASTGGRGADNAFECRAVTAVSVPLFDRIPSCSLEIENSNIR